jgi:hypothetical protein
MTRGEKRELLRRVYRLEAKAQAVADHDGDPAAARLARERDEVMRQIEMRLGFSPARAPQGAGG